MEEVEEEVIVGASVTGRRGLYMQKGLPVCGSRVREEVLAARAH